MNNTAFTNNCKPEITISRVAPRMVGIKEASDILGLSEPFLCRGFRSGELVGVRCGTPKGGKILLNLDWLIDYLNSHKEQPTSEPTKKAGIEPIPANL